MKLFSVVFSVVFSAKYEERDAVCYYISLADYNIIFQPRNIKFSNVLAQILPKVKFRFVLFM